MCLHHYLPSSIDAQNPVLSPCSEEAGRPSEQLLCTWDRWDRAKVSFALSWFVLWILPGGLKAEYHEGAEPTATIQI